MTEGKKFDTGKPRYDLIPPEAKRALAEQLRYGADKYGDRNWELGLHFGRLVRATEGHLTEWWAGNDLDEEGRPHLHGAITSLAMLLALVDRHVGSEWDDRPVRPISPQSTPNMGAQMQRVATHLVNTSGAFDEFRQMVRAASALDFEDTKPVKVDLNYGYPLGPETARIFYGTPVETSESSGKQSYCPKCTELYEGEVCPCSWEGKSEETDQSTGGNRVKYTHKVHYQTSVFGEIMCDTKNIRKMSDRANDVTCGRCLKMMA